MSFISRFKENLEQVNSCYDHYITDKIIGDKPPSRGVAAKVTAVAVALFAATVITYPLIALTTLAITPWLLYKRGFQNSVCLVTIGLGSPIFTAGKVFQAAAGIFRPSLLANSAHPHTPEDTHSRDMRPNRLDHSVPPVNRGEETSLEDDPFLDILREERYVTVKHEDGKVNIDLSGRFRNFNDISPLLNSIIETYGEENVSLNVVLSPSNVGSENIESRLSFLQNFGSSITILSLRDLVVPFILKELPSALTSLKVTNCYTIEELPELPLTLTSLNIRGCRNLKKLPDILSTNITSINLEGCTALSREERTRLFLALIEQDFRHGINLLPSLGIDYRGGIPVEIVSQMEKSFKKEEDIEVVLNLPLEHKRLIQTIYAEAQIAIIDFEKYLQHESGFHSLEYILNYLSRDYMHVASRLRIKLERILSYTLSPTQWNRAAEVEDGRVENIPNVRTDQIRDLLNRITTTDNRSLFYLNPRSTAFNDDGTQRDFDYAREGLNTLLSNIRNRRPYIGTPRQGPALERWYTKLENKLKCIIALAQQKIESGDRGEIFTAIEGLAKLGIGGHHCGGRWMLEANQLHNMLSGNLRSEDLDKEIAAWKGEYIIGVLEEFALHFTPEVGDVMQPHLYNFAGKELVARGITLPENVAVDLEDSLDPHFNNPDAPLRFIDSKMDARLFTVAIRGRLTELLKERPEVLEEIVAKLRVHVEEKLLPTSQYGPRIRDLESGLDASKIAHGRAVTEELIAAKRARIAEIEGWKQDPDITVDESEEQELEALPREIAELERRLLGSGDLEKLREAGAERATVALRNEREKSIDALIDEYAFLKEDKESTPTGVTFTGTMALLESLGYLQR